MPSHPIADARRQLSDLIDAAQRGEDVVLTRNGWPVARLQPYHQSRPPAEALLGALKGRIALHDGEPEAEPEDSDARHAGA